MENELKKIIDDIYDKKDIDNQNKLSLINYIIKYFFGKDQTNRYSNNIDAYNDIYNNIIDSKYLQTKRTETLPNKDKERVGYSEQILVIDSHRNVFDINRKHEKIRSSINNVLEELLADNTLSNIDINDKDMIEQKQLCTDILTLSDDANFHTLLGSDDTIMFIHPNKINYEKGTKRKIEYAYHAFAYKKEFIRYSISLITNVKITQSGVPYVLIPLGAVCTRTDAIQLSQIISILISDINRIYYVLPIEQKILLDSRSYDSSDIAICKGKNCYPITNINNEREEEDDSEYYSKDYKRKKSR